MDVYNGGNAGLANYTYSAATALDFTNPITIVLNAVGGTAGDHEIELKHFVITKYLK
jgi:hypothetical protein